MSLIKCEECGKEISDKAGSCPNCGCPVNLLKDEKQGLENQNNNTVSIELNHAKALVASGELDRAKELYESLIEKYPDDSRVYKECFKFEINIKDPEVDQGILTADIKNTWLKEHYDYCNYLYKEYLNCKPENEIDELKELLVQLEKKNIGKEEKNNKSNNKRVLVSLILLILTIVFAICSYNQHSLYQQWLEGRLLQWEEPGSGVGYLFMTIISGSGFLVALLGDNIGKNK